MCDRATAIRSPPKIFGELVRLDPKRVLRPDWVPVRVPVQHPVRVSVRVSVPTPVPIPPALDGAHRLTRVSDRDLAVSIPALFAYHRSYGFFQDAFDGMQLLRGVGPDGRLEVQLAPHRKKAPVDKVDHGPDVCPLCNPPDPKEIGIAWRNFVIWPNAYPHAPIESEHVVITSAFHHAQSFDPTSLADLIDYQRIAGAQKPLTLHFNGTAGNSQFHWHWQGTHEHLPLERALDAGEIALRTIRKDRGGEVASFSDEIYSGILVRGDKGSLVRWAGAIIAALDGDPLSRGTYNLMLIPPKDGASRLLIFPRRKLDRPPQIEGYGPFDPGAFGQAGRPVVSRPAIPDRFGENFLAGIECARLRPKDIGWLDSLRTEAPPTISCRTRTRAA